MKKYLSGSAQACISGLTLSSENYKEAISILQNRYGNPQILISAYIDSLLKIRKVKSSDNVINLRKLYNDTENCVHSLKILKVETSTYGCLLIPILKDRLPDGLKLFISRKFGNEIWTLRCLVKIYYRRITS